jgi:hypothetical protein
MSAMALIVNPVIVRVRFISVPGAAAIVVLLFQPGPNLPTTIRSVAAVPGRRIGHHRPRISSRVVTVWLRPGCAS